MGGRDQKKVEEDYEIFLRDLEDPELRSCINLYKASDVKMDGPEEKVGVKKGQGKKVQYAMEVDESDVVPERVPASAAAHDEEDVDEEADFPNVKLDELLEGFDELTLGDGGAEDQVL